MLQCVAVCCSVLQCVAVCCSVLQCVAVCCSVLQGCSELTYVAQVSLIPNSSGGNGAASFGHIMGGYDAGVCTCCSGRCVYVLQCITMVLHLSGTLWEAMT